MDLFNEILTWAFLALWLIGCPVALLVQSFRLDKAKHELWMARFDLRHAKIMHEADMALAASDGAPRDERAS